MRRRYVGYAAASAAISAAFSVFAFGIGAPLWLEILALVAAGAVWYGYLWKYTRWGEPVREAMARRRAAEAEKERESRDGS